ncbi:stalk domain-containing protein [Paenibacillus sp. MMS20-IR301]|uniref:stalk domain-containing protein n=1 Tax=Paenibacillus sp. MMS20-IR301 TaxID=2895946 RepID=UPI0028F0CA0C|nr:stalk domain-containing protein [Paenibacillus sp. MMS20-IR301]WNS44725.1 stalk domain-containing protein [Paenibacillus sp. MMS20-IR301]
MKKVLSGIMLMFALAMASSPAHAAARNIQIKIDDVVISSDVAAEIRNGHTMVPLRVISENLGARVTGTNSEIILTRNNMQVKLKLNSGNVTKNGESVFLDAKPYLKNNRTMVPLRFLSETFGCQVGYSNSTVTVNSEALVIDQVKIKALQEEYHMIMGGVVQQIEGNAYITAIHDVITDNLGNKVEAPEHYSWTSNIDIPGSYYKERQFDFLDANGKSIKRYDIYTINRSFPEQMLKPYPEGLIHDATSDQWYLFSEAARTLIYQNMDTATKNGFLKIISNTIA